MWSDFTGLWIPKLVQGLHWALLSTSPLTGSCFGSCLFSCFRHRATRHGTWLHSQVHTQFQLFLQPAPLPPLVIYLLPIQWILLSCDTTQAPHFFQTSDGYLDSFLATARSSYPTLLLGIITVWPCHTVSMRRKLLFLFEGLDPLPASADQGNYIKKWTYKSLPEDLMYSVSLLLPRSHCNRILIC